MRVFGPIATAVVFAYGFVAAANAAGTLVFTTIDVPGAMLTSAQGINRQDDIVGSYTDAAGKSHGFLRSGGQYRTIDFPNSRASVARGINDSGDIVGSYQRESDPPGGIPSHGFLLTRRGGLQTIDYPGHLNTIPQHILADGTILGCYHDTDTMGTMHGMMFRRGFSAMDMGMSMNNGGTTDGRYIVGFFTDNDGRTKAFVVDGGRFSALEVPGALGTNAQDMNPSGVIAGVYTDAGGAVHGYEYDGRSFTRVDAPGATATRVFGINEQGDLVGIFVDTAGRTHSFLAQVSQ